MDTVGRLAYTGLSNKPLVETMILPGENPEVEADEYGDGFARLSVDRAALIRALQKMEGDSVSLKVAVTAGPLDCNNYYNEQGKHVLCTIAEAEHDICVGELNLE